MRIEMSYGRGTYEGVYIIYLRKGNMEKSHLGTTSKLQSPKLFMKSIYEIYPTMEFVPVTPQILRVFFFCFFFFTILGPT